MLGNKLRPTAQQLFYTAVTWSAKNMKFRPPPSPLRVALRVPALAQRLCENRDHTSRNHKYRLGFQIPQPAQTCNVCGRKRKLCLNHGSRNHPVWTEEVQQVKLRVHSTCRRCRVFFKSRSIAAITAACYNTLPHGSQCTPRRDVVQKRLLSFLQKPVLCQGGGSR